MPQQEPHFALRSKIWIEDDSGKVAFGLGRYKMLAAIDRLGSMNKAARELKISYRSVWCRIRESEERIGHKLVESKGKGSALTPFARNLMEQYMKLEENIQKDADKLFKQLLSGSLENMG